MKKTALVLEGGSFRTMFTAGILDVLLDTQIRFDYLIGVSAGTLVALNYLSKQKRRSAYINLNYVQDKRYISLANYFQSDGVINFDFLFDILGKDDAFPFDYTAFNQDQSEFEVVATNCLNGQAEYFSKKDHPHDIYTIIKASGSLPLASKEIYLNNIPYLDGGIADSIPINHVIEKGYDKIVVILTQDPSYRKTSFSKVEADIMKMRYRKYPRFLTTLENRHRTYNASLDTIRDLEMIESIYVIRPKNPVTVGRIEKDTEKLKALYEEGLQAGQEHADAIQRFLIKEN